MKNSCVVVLVLLGLAQSAMSWPLEEILVAEADFHPVEINSGRFARSAPTTKAPVAARGHHAAAGSKANHHAAGHAKTSAAAAAKPNTKKVNKHQKRQVHPHKAAAGKERSHQDKKHQAKKAPAKHSKNVKVHKAAAQHHK